MFYFFTLSSKSAHNNDDILYWSQNHRLGFADFKGKPS